MLLLLEVPHDLIVKLLEVGIWLDVPVCLVSSISENR